MIFMYHSDESKTVTRRGEMKGGNLPVFWIATGVDLNDQILKSKNA
jgi:hypothetical protein